jgi:UDP-N-acetylmuramoyl-L-alanyl-D-glutamate--2,6-diaminopimelate ligase
MRVGELAAEVDWATVDWPSSGAPRDPASPIADLIGSSDAEILDITMDSRDVAPGAMFACVRGQHYDGHDLAPEAVAAGATALLCSRPMDAPVAQLIVPDVRSALGPVAAAFWGHPSRMLRVVGVTGTNGKTTTCALLRDIFEGAGWRSEVLGTLSGSRTTPEAPVLQRRLAELRSGGIEALAMEVSSHALDQHRVDATSFVAGIFTNLSQDHLDYHPSMEAYFEAKARLFAPGRVGVAVINRADPWGRRLADRVHAAGGPPLVTFAPDDALDVRLGPSSSRFRWQGLDLTVGLGGRFNVVNAVGAATAARALGVADAAIIEGLARHRGVRGRFQPVEVGQPFTVLVDYAHTPDGLVQVLQAARELATSGRVLIVFGAGGERDHGKRPAMGEISTRLADLAVLTSDNPRHEDPMSILDQVASGADRRRLVIEVDRARAIADALAAAEAGDVVIIAGKGHETGQDFGTHTEPFDDVEVATASLRRILASRERRS